MWPSKRPIKTDFNEKELTSLTMEDRVQRTLSAAWNRSLTVIAISLVALVSLSVAAMVKIESSQKAVAKYVSVWEEEIARNLLLSGERELFDKVIAQVSDFAPEVSTVFEAGKGQCQPNDLNQSLSITLYGTPAGRLTICRSPMRLILESLRSPVFLVGLILGALILLWHTRRKTAEAASLAIAEATKTLAKQVAHDLRSPLGALNIVATKIRTRRDPSSIEQEAALISVLQSSVQRISKIADDLLSHDRLKKSCLAAPPTVSQLNKAIHEVIKEMKLGAEASGAVLIPEVDPQSSFHADSNTSDQSDDHSHDQVNDQHCSELARVVSNLIQNAIEAPQVMGLKREVKVSTRVSDRDFEIEITDNGNGIPENSWRNFGRRGFTVGKSNGNGLGVSHAREWTSSVGGKLRVRSAKNVGTAITLTLPR